MKCPACGRDEDKVLETRVQNDGDIIRRRRECLACHVRFTTVESLVRVFPMVIKKDGRREPFSEVKLLKGLQAACQKRPISLAQIEQIVEEISQWTLSRNDSEIATRLIGERVMLALRQLDHVAYVRFASVYRDFKDVHEFVSSLETHSIEPVKGH